MTTTPSYYQLPNGLLVAHVNKHETDFLYKEIFDCELYLQHGIVLKEGAIVFDVGANIGLFTVFAKQRSPSCRVVAFEPSRNPYRCLQYNVARYGGDVVAHPWGLWCEEAEATLTYYPNNTLLSGVHGNHEEQVRFLKGYLRHYLMKNACPGREPFAWYVDSLTNDLLKTRQEESCQMRTVSGVLRDMALERIDLLKIDVEGCEMAILQGIVEADWPRIKQIALEVHAGERVNASQLCAFLEAKGLKVNVADQKELSEVGLTNVYAVRGSR